MPRTHQFTAKNYTEVEELIKKTKDAKLIKKLEVLQLRIEGYKNAEISKITKYSKSRVSALVCIYANAGIAYFEKENRIGGNRRNLSYEEEKEFLEIYRQQAEQGQIIEVGEIKRAYEEKIGHSIGGSQIYYILHRHGWRKVMPRSKHPNKASDEVIKASKKLT